MYRNDEAARAAYVAALERKAARVAELEDRIRALEAENRQLRAARLRGPAPEQPDSGDVEIQVDRKVKDYVAALINATDPRLTDGILSGALGSDAASVLEAARIRARTAGRRHVTPADVRGAALEVLPTRIMMIDPEVDPSGIVRAILDVVKAP